ncbi:hypothetical protein ACFSFZ_13725 [Mixta tenebrionis]|uniref:Lipoprotein n=1 Tax=Mixta tenebrionis TaxID=2562439 RepID=A0A506VFC7_9GAMM|nr:MULTISPECIES: hypothetical protein [Mixta]QHM75810.1 hypothetical protein C7M52_01767 [Mixta theicola]TPW44345.1 hypothetical protein FKM52_01125 [Mixta tenebrionis]
MLRVMVLTLPLLLAACSSGPPGIECPGKVASLYGGEIATTHGTIFDLVNSFSVANEKVKVESGPLYSSDRSRYIPAAVTKEGYLAQRISARQFRLIDPQQDKMITYTCGESSAR